MRKILDISLPLGPGLVIWPNNPPLMLEPRENPPEGSSYVSRLSLGTHTGTHVDPPAHAIEGGLTVDHLSLDVLVGPAVVADFSNVSEAIGPAELEAANLPAQTTRLLLKTRNSRRWHAPEPQFSSDYVSLAVEGAAWLVERGFKLVGIDYLSIEPFRRPGRPTHRTLLTAGAIIVEGLDLAEVAPGQYTLVCLPLKLVGGDGSPARAILISG